jgi:branched-chain amino acid transport system ATP-binding protein
MALRLALQSVSSGYLSTPVIRDISFEVHAGEVVVLLGPNGAGKTTTLLTAAGVLRPSSGRVWWNGNTKWMPLHRRARTGLGFVAEERSIFMSMTTSENLRMGRGEIERVLELFPELESRMSVLAGLLSGGEQQMLALGRALAARPDVLLVDELSLGLAPLAADRLLASLRRAVDEDGTAVVLVEQNLMKAVAIADTAHVIRRGRIRESPSGCDLRSRPRDDVIGQLLGHRDAEPTARES